MLISKGTAFEDEDYFNDCFTGAPGFHCADEVFSYVLIISNYL